jgi:hypothetical protein
MKLTELTERQKMNLVEAYTIILEITYMGLKKDIAELLNTGTVSKEVAVELDFGLGHIADICDIVKPHFADSCANNSTLTKLWKDSLLERLDNIDEQVDWLRKKVDIVLKKN